MTTPIETRCRHEGTCTTLRSRWCPEHGPAFGAGCAICDTLDAELQDAIDSDPDVAGACCPCCEDEDVCPGCEEHKP